MEIIERLAAFLVPFALGTLGTLVASTFITAKRLRTELQQESEVLERLPPGARSQLRADVQRRTLLLVSINRFPPVTRVDILALGSVALCLAATASISYALVIDRVEVLEFGTAVIFLPFYALASWWVFEFSWAPRAMSRLRYVHKHLGAADAQLIARMVLVGYALSMLALLASLVSMPVGTGAWFYADGVISVEILIIVGAIVSTVALVTVIKMSVSGELAMELQYAMSGYDPAGMQRHKWFPAFETERDEEMQNL